jgi:hypothetical protein
MKLRCGNSTPVIRAFACLAFIAAFVFLSFCPLRNTLVNFAEREPFKKAQPAPDYAKITAGQACDIAAFNTNTLPGTTQLVYPLSPPYGLSYDASFNFSPPFIYAGRAIKSKCTSKIPNLIPAYLRNCVWLI